MPCVCIEVYCYGKMDYVLVLDSLFIFKCTFVLVCLKTLDMFFVYPSDNTFAL